jgi:hypothetical protein
MLPIDHLPFPTPDTGALAAAFERLGFTVTPECAYASPEGGHWRNRCVVFEAGWFDLLQEPLAAADEAAPFACLFLAQDLDEAVAALGEVKTSEVFTLERRIEDAPPEAFRYRNVRARISPLFVSIIEHAWPCPDIRPEWRAHANGAVAVDGITFGEGEPGVAAEVCGRVLDLSGFRYLAPTAFAARYGSPRRPIAVRLRVRDLAETAQALRGRDIAFEGGESLIVRAPEGFGCSFEFVATAG